MEVALQRSENLERYFAEAEIKLRNLIVHPSNFVTFQCYTTEGLQKLHEIVLCFVSEVRLRDVPSIWERNNVKFNPEKEENIRQYGYADAFEFYDPHFTIGRVVEKMKYKTELDFAIEKARKAGEILMPYFGKFERVQRYQRDLLRKN